MINALKLAGTQAPVRIYRAGSRNRVPAGRVPANLQAPAIGCLQACRHPAGTQKVPSRHPGSDAGCLQAPCRHPESGACWAPAGACKQQAPDPGCLLGAAGAGDVDRCTVHFRTNLSLGGSSSRCKEQLALYHALRSGSRLPLMVYGRFSAVSAGYSNTVN